MLKSFFQNVNRAALVLGLLAGWAGLSGCQSSDKPSHSSSGVAQSGGGSGGTASSSSSAVGTPAQENAASLPLREGDTVKIDFPGAPSLDTIQAIRLDGKITLSMVGEIKAAGLTPQELQAQLLKAYDSQLVVKEVSVTVQGGGFDIYVTGAVLRPGKLVSDHIETPLQAVVEAGIDHSKANLKKVVITREHPNGKTEKFKLNLDAVLRGNPAPPFTLQPNDIIYVPEKFMFY